MILGLLSSHYQVQVMLLVVLGVVYCISLIVWRIEKADRRQRQADLERRLLADRSNDNAKAYYDGE
jgi:hypothetical protein